LKKYECYWDGSCHFEPWSDDKDDTLSGSLSKLPHHTSGRTFGHCVACNGRHTRRIFWRIGVSSLEPSGRETETLPLGHCGRFEWLKEKNRKHNNGEIKRKH
ncbi:hypothetical protein AVEN_119506-1, partial [Araneus ventricosus]